MQGRKKRGVVKPCVFCQIYIACAGIVAVLRPNVTYTHEDSIDHLRWCPVICWLAGRLGFTATSTTFWWKEWMNNHLGRIRMTFDAGGDIEYQKACEMIRWFGMLYTLYNMIKHGSAPRNLDSLLDTARHILDDMECPKRRRKRTLPRTKGDG